VGLDAGRSPAARSATTARWRRRKELRRATPSPDPSAAKAGAEDAEAWRRWRECAAEMGEVEVDVARPRGESGVGPSRKRDLRRGFGGREGDGDGGAEEAKGSERGGDERMDARCRISSPIPPGCQCLQASKHARTPEEDQLSGEDERSRRAPWAAKLAQSEVRLQLGHRQFASACWAIG